MRQRACSRTPCCERWPRCGKRCPWRRHGSSLGERSGSGPGKSPPLRDQRLLGRSLWETAGGFCVLVRRQFHVEHPEDTSEIRDRAEIRPGLRWRPSEQPHVSPRPGRDPSLSGPPLPVTSQQVSAESHKSFSDGPPREGSRPGRWHSLSGRSRRPASSVREVRQADEHGATSCQGAAFAGACSFTWNAPMSHLFHRPLPLTYPKPTRPPARRMRCRSPDRSGGLRRPAALLFRSVGVGRRRGARPGARRPRGPPAP